MWLYVLCQPSSKSKAPSGSTDSSSQSLVTPAANPIQNTNNYFSANTEYWDIKELNKLETLCWTLCTKSSLPCRILICSLPRASLAALELLQVYSTVQTEYFTFFSNQKKTEIFPCCCFRRTEFQSHSDKQKNTAYCQKIYFFDFLTCPHYDAACIFENGTTAGKKKQPFRASQMKQLLM